MHMKNRWDISYFCQEGFRNIFLHGFMSFAAIGIIAACLLITGSMSLISMNIASKIQELQDESEIVIYLDESVPRDEAEAFSDKLMKISNVSEVEFVPNEEALADCQKEFGSLFDGFDQSNNPLRDGYRIHLKDLSKASSTVEQIRQLDGVANIQVNEDTISMLVKLKKVFQVTSVGLLIVLGGISLFIISNTVKMAMFTRREEIAIMKMVGATDWFIRWPFIIEGFLIGLVGGLIAFFAQWGLYERMDATIQGMIGIFKMINFSTIWLPAFFIFLLAGVLIGVVGSILTIRKFLDV